MNPSLREYCSGFTEQTLLIACNECTYLEDIDYSHIHIFFNFENLVPPLTSDFIEYLEYCVFDMKLKRIVIVANTGCKVIRQALGPNPNTKWAQFLNQILLANDLFVPAVYEVSDLFSQMVMLVVKEQIRTLSQVDFIQNGLQKHNLEVQGIILDEGNLAMHQLDQNSIFNI